VLTDPAPRRALGRAETVMLVALAVALSLGVALRQGADENLHGNMGYLHVAESSQVLAGRGFGRFYRDVFYPDLFLRPTYTLFVSPVSAFVEGWTSIRACLAALQGGLLAVTAIAVAGCLSRVGAPRPARIAAWGVIFHPVLVSQSSTLVDTVLFTAAMVGAYAFFASTPGDAPRRRWLVAGLILGVALLTRSTALAVVPASALAVGRAVRSWRGRLAAAGLVAVGVVAVLTPWALRNHALTDRLLLSTVDGVNLWMGNNENTSRFLDVDRSLDELPGRARFDSSDMQPVPVQMERYDAARAAASDFIRAHPDEAVALAARKAADLWAVRPTPRSTHSKWHETKSLIAVLWTVPLFAFAAFGAVVALRAGGALRAFAGDVLVTCVVFTLPHALAWGGTRLRAPLDPFVVALAAVGVAAALARVQSRSERGASHAAAATINSGSSG
jgi:hypothetical protein